MPVTLYLGSMDLSPLPTGRLTLGKSSHPYRKPECIPSILVIGEWCDFDCIGNLFWQNKGDVALVPPTIGVKTMFHCQLVFLMVPLTIRFQIVPMGSHKSF